MIDTVHELFLRNEPLTVIADEIETCKELIDEEAYELFSRLLQHACQNSELEREVALYSHTIALLHKSVRFYRVSYSIFTALLNFLQMLCHTNEEDFEDERYRFRFGMPLGDSEQLFSLIEIGVKTCFLIIDADVDEDFTKYQISSLCHIIPTVSLVCLSNLDHEAVDSVILDLTTIIQLIVTKDLDQSDSLDDANAHQIILNLLLLERCTDTLSDTLYDTISILIESKPQMVINQSTMLHPLTNALSADIAISENKLRALFNLSFLLMNNNLTAPWLTDVLREYEQLPTLSKYTMENLKNKLIGLSTTLHNDDIINDSRMHCFDTETALNRLFECNNADEAELILLELKASLLQEDANFICRPWMKDISQYVTRIFISNPALAESVAQIFDYTTQGFLEAHIQHVLPYTIMYLDDVDILDNIAVSLDISLSDLCREKATELLSALFMEQDRTARQSGYRRLQVLLGNRSIVKELAKDHFISITVNIAIKIGCPGMHETVLNALHELDTVSGSKLNSIAKIISTFRFTAILIRVSEFISQKRDGIPDVDIQDPFALQSLQSLILILGNDVANHASHLKQVIDSVVGIPDMQEQALLLWDTFISLLKKDALSTHIHLIVDGLLNIAHVAETSLCDRIGDILRRIIVEEDLHQDCYQFMPEIPNIEGLESIKEYVESKRLTRMVKRGEDATAQQVQSTVKSILLQLDAYEDNQVCGGLEKLRRLLDGYEVSFRPEQINELYGKLCNLFKKYSSHAKITYHAAICLGKLGARNPSDVDIKDIDDTVFVLYGFQSEEENWNFVRDLIQNHIYPTYQGAAKEDLVLRRRLEYTIQTLLQQNILGGISPTASRRQQQQREAAFRQFPLPLQEFLRPFLESSYFISNYKAENAKYPIFTRAQTFQQWVKKWYLQMINQATGAARRIFFACAPIVESDLTNITTHLLPYLVLHTVVSRTQPLEASLDDENHIVNELMDVFTANAKQASVQEVQKSKHKDINFLSLQVALAIVDYCQKWMRKMNFNDTEKRRQVEEVRSVLRRIPSNLLATAAFTGGAFEQALMYFEMNLNERQHHPYNVQSRKREVQKLFDFLQVIYKETGHTTDLHSLVQSYGNYGSLLDQWQAAKCFESLSKWDDAIVLRKNDMLRHSTDLNSHIAYLESLSMGSQHDLLLQVSDTICRSKPQWASSVNPYRVDAAWRTENWELLSEAVLQPMQRNYPSLLGCTLNSLRKGHCLGALITIDEARRSLIDEFQRYGGARVYQKCYPILFKFQMLQELEDSESIWQNDNPIPQIQDIVSNWKQTRRLIDPNGSYREQLLQIRKAALFDIRNSHLETTLLEDKLSLRSQLLLDIAKNYRKTGKNSAALSALAKANGASYYYKEKVKWLWSNDYAEEAIRLLETEIDKHPDANDALLLLELWDNDCQKFAHAIDKNCLAHVNRVSTEKREKGYYLITKYWKSRLERVGAKSRSTTLIKHLKMQNCLISNSSKALSLGSKYYYFTMSTFMNAWFALMDLTENMKAYDLEKQGQIREYYSTNIIPHIDKSLNCIPTYHFIQYLTRIISHLTTNNLKMVTWLKMIITRVLVSYPRQTIYMVLGSLESQSNKISTRVREIIEEVTNRYKDTQIPEILLQATTLKDRLKRLSLYEPADKQTTAIDMRRIGSSGVLVQLKDLKLYLPKENAMLPQLPESIDQDKPADVYPSSDVPTIQQFDMKVVVMKSLQRPKRIAIHGSDGRKYYFLLKKEDDLRKDARTMEFEYMLNDVFKKNRGSRDQGLYIRTFAVIPLGFDWGLLEWIENLESLKSIVSGYWEAAGGNSVQLVTMKMNKSKSESPEENHKLFMKSIMPLCPSVFYKWFIERFPEPNQWLDSRTRYIKTLAVMSIVGHVIGLGDRHAENILFDSTNGDCVHVDLNMIFDKGSNLPVPEIVPFRLTHNLIIAMGPLGTDGLFKKTCEATLKVLVENKESLISVFESYVNELTAAVPNPLAADKVKKIGEKLRGGRIEETVRVLIAQASDPFNLAQMFPGWAPFV